jgi:hypothetical protein
MTTKKHIQGSPVEIWRQINDDFATSGRISDYNVVLDYDGTVTELDIDSSPGGSEEGGYDTTVLSSNIKTSNGFRFEIHPQDFLNKLGKMLGMQDVTIGYPEFDENVIVKTNNEAEVKQVFSDATIREVFQQQSGYSFGIVEEDGVEKLQLSIQRAVTGTELEQLFTAFYKVLGTVSTSVAS